MRSNFKVTFVESETHTAQNGEKYIFGKAKDSTFDGFIFWFSPDEPVHVGDIISGEFSDPRAPLTIQGVFLEQTFVDPSTIIEAPELIQLPQEPAPDAVPSEDEWRFAATSGSYLCEVDIAQMSRAVLKLEARVKQLESTF